MTDDRYVRDVDSSGNDSTSWLVNEVPVGATVLDVGCGPGTIGTFLVDKKSCTVDGVELSEDFCERARVNYRAVWQSDLEVAQLLSIVGETRYDRVICADVLEHLRDPKPLIQQLANVLKPGGKILISIPNVSYTGLIMELLHGRFDYRPNGLLDDTHVRFFTRQTLIELLSSSGLAIETLEGIVMPLADSEFGIDRMHVLGPSLFNMLIQRPDALTYQFALACAPGDTSNNHSFAQSEVQIDSFKTADGFAESLLALKQQIFALESKLGKKDAAVQELEAQLRLQNEEVERRGVELDKKRAQLAAARAELDSLKIQLRR